MTSGPPGPHGPGGLSRDDPAAAHHPPYDTHRNFLLRYRRDSVILIIATLCCVSQFIKRGLAMKTLHTSIVIEANAATVWRQLVDFESHADWNPFFASITGQPVVGEQLTVVARKNLDNSDPATGMTFRPEVLVAEPGVELRWRGKLAIGGLFDGTHYFVLTDRGDGTTALEHGEEFRGILIPFMGRVLRQTEVGFLAFNEALKARAEAACRCPSS